MKCLKLNEYINRVASVEKTGQLYEDLKVSIKTINNNNKLLQII